MQLKNIHIKAFRNIKNLSIPFNKKNILFVGDNGSGKTSILEAIHYLCCLKSFRSPNGNDLIMWGANDCVIKGTFTDKVGCQEYEVRFGPGEKSYFKDFKVARRASDYLESIWTIAFTPEDSQLLRGDLKGRRNLIDRLIFSTDPGYLSIYRDYMKQLSNKNRCIALRRSKAETVIWNEQLVDTGAEIISKRKDVIEALNSYLSPIFREIVGSRTGTLHIQYSHSTKALNGAPVDLKGAFRSDFDRYYSEELERGFSVVGPHRDQIVFKIDNKDAKKYASQGEIKSALLSYRFAELNYFNSRKGVSPPFILDDISSEIDIKKRNKIITHLTDQGIQLFMSSTSQKDLNISYNKWQVLNVSDGQII